jgi:sulfate adenylyltransferase
MKFPIEPHGGTLVNRVVDETEDKVIQRDLSKFPSILLNDRELSDIEMIASGALSPLTGYMTEETYESVLNSMRLSSRLPWSLPITLSVPEAESAKYKVGERVALAHSRVGSLAILDLKEKFHYDKGREAKLVYGTEDRSHPGVDALYRQGDLYLAGTVSLLQPIPHRDFPTHRLSPSQTRQVFKERGWRRVVGFQTRNPIHRAHEYIQKCALEAVDGILIHPLVGETKGDDVPADVRMKSYEVLLEHYYPKDRVLLSVMPAAMRYAGPREAIFHAIIRKNYGCTHFIVGRDHAGFKNFYGPFDAQKIFDEFESQELGITPIFFDNTYYCRRCQQMASPKTCPHPPSEHLSLSGTKVREMLREGKSPPLELTRPEVAAVLVDAMRSKLS